MLAACSPPPSHARLLRHERRTPRARRISAGSDGNDGQHHFLPCAPHAKAKERNQTREGSWVSHVRAEQCGAGGSRGSGRGQRESTGTTTQNCCDWLSETQQDPTLRHASVQDHLNLWVGAGGGQKQGRQAVGGMLTCCMCMPSSLQSPRRIQRRWCNVPPVAARSARGVARRATSPCARGARAVGRLAGAGGAALAVALRADRAATGDSLYHRPASPLGETARTSGKVSSQYHCWVLLLLRS